MRNGIFFGAVAAALVGGGLIGWFGDFSALARASGRTPVSAPADPFAPRVEGLQFSIDTTRNSEPRPARSSSGYIPAGDYGYEPNGCVMPRTEDGTRVVLLSVYSGDALSTVALDTQDEETGVIEVVIEPGEQPLYVVLSNFSPTIWRFSGHTARVQRAVMVASKGSRGRVVSHGSAGSAHGSMDAAARRARDAARSAGSDLRRMTSPTRAYAGVMGLDPDRVSTSEDIRCFDYFSSPDSLKAIQAGKVVRRAVGRAPDVVASHYSLAAIRLPSAEGARGTGRLPVPQGFEGAMWREAVRFNKWGVASIRPAEIISAVRPVTYEVLPHQAGLAQLLGSGQLERSSAGLRIVKPIARFPASLGGAHATQFVLPRGVPMPAGDPGHSCVVVEGGGRSVGSPMC